MNKYYEMFINENVDESIFKCNPSSLSYEDHFWHFACMSIYYKKNNELMFHKKSLSAACDLNYYYNAMLYLDAYEVLPQNYKKHIKKFEHKMKDDKLEDLIIKTNKMDKSKNGKSFLMYSLTTLLIVPLMLFLVLVLKLDTTVATIIAIVALVFGQGFISPIFRQVKQNKTLKKVSELPKEQKQFFNYLLTFEALLNDEKNVALIRAENEEQRSAIVKLIKTNRPIPEELKNKKKKKKQK